MRKFITLVILCSFVTTIVLYDVALTQGQSSGYSLAVLNFTADNSTLTRTDLRLATKQFTEAMSNEGLFTTLSQNDMERTLYTNNIDPSECSTFDCAMRAGRVLGVQLVLYGTIIQNGSRFTIDTEMVHIGSGEAVKEFQDDVSGDVNDLLTNMDIYAKKFIGLPVTESPPQEAKAEPVAVETTQQETKPEPVVAVETTQQETKPEPVVAVETTETFDEPFVDEPKTDEPTAEKPPRRSGGGLKWYYIGLGLLFAGGVSAGLVLINDVGATQQDPPPPPPVFTELPGPPQFP